MSRYRRERVSIETARGGFATRRLLLWLSDRLEDAPRAPSLTVGDAPSVAAEGSLHLGDRLYRRVSGAWRALLEPDADGDLVLPDGRVRASALEVPDGEGGWEPVGGGGSVPEIRNVASQTIAPDSFGLLQMAASPVVAGDGITFSDGLWTIANAGIYAFQVDLMAQVAYGERGLVNIGLDDDGTLIAETVLDADARDFGGESGPATPLNAGLIPFQARLIASLAAGREVGIRMNTTETFFGGSFTNASIVLPNWPSRVTIQRIADLP